MLSLPGANVIWGRWCCYRRPPVSSPCSIRSSPRTLCCRPSPVVSAVFLRAKQDNLHPSVSPVLVLQRNVVTPPEGFNQTHPRSRDDRSLYSLLAAEPRAYSLLGGRRLYPGPGGTYQRSATLPICRRTHYVLDEAAGTSNFEVRESEMRCCVRRIAVDPTLTTKAAFSIGNVSEQRVTLLGGESGLSLPEKNPHTRARRGQPRGERGSRRTWA